MQSHTGSRIRIGALAAITFIALGSAWLIVRADPPVGAQEKGSSSVARGSEARDQATSKEARAEEFALELAKLTADAVDNITFCAQHYLDGAPADGAENYRLCAAGASDRFSNQINKDGPATDVLTVMQISEAKRVIAVWENVQFRVASAPAVGGVAGPAQQQAFADCVADLDANVNFCNGHYPAGSPYLDVCIEGAKTAFKGCAGKAV